MAINTKSSPGEIQNRSLHMEDTKIPKREADHFWLVDGRFDKGFPGSSAGKESTCNAGDPGSIPRSGRSPGERIGYPLQCSFGFPQPKELVKNSPAMQETWVRSLGWEDPLEEDMATRSSILAWRIPVDREAWWATVHGVTKCQTWLSNKAQHRFDKQGNLYMSLVLSSCNTSRSLHLFSRILRVYIEALIGFSRYSVQMVSTTPNSLKAASLK